MSKTWRSHIIFHKNLLREHYEVDKTFDLEKYTFIKTNEKVDTDYDAAFFGQNIIKEWEIGNTYNPDLQQKSYMAPSAIYHAYKNKLHSRYDYVGFMEYDLIFNEDTTDAIQKLVDDNDELIVPFSYQHPLKRLRGQGDIRMDNKNCIDHLFEMYNSHYKTNHKIKKYESTLVTSQQSFLCDVNTFKRVMPFIVKIIDGKLCEKSGCFRRPSTILDRAFGIALMLDKVEKKPIHLKHKSMHQWKDVKPSTKPKKKVNKNKTK